MTAVVGPKRASTAQTYSTAEFLRGIRLAVSSIASTVMTALVPVHYHLAIYGKAAPVQVACYACLAAVVIGEWVLLRTGRGWGPWRWPAAAAALVAASTSSMLISHGLVLTSTDWAFGTVGWIGAILFLDRPLILLIGFLAAHQTFTVGHILLSGQGSRQVMSEFLVASLDAVGFPLSVGIAARLLTNVATAARLEHQEAERIRTAEALDGQRFLARRQRYEELSAAVIPLLRGLADRTLDPGDQQVQRRCAIEASRMRRLFAEADTVDGKLLHELRAGVQVVERRGVVTTLDVKGSATDPPTPVRRALLDAPLAALANAATWGKVSIIHTRSAVAVSVVCDMAAIRLPEADGSAVTLSVEFDGEVAWVQTDWTTPER